MRKLIAVLLALPLFAQVMERIDVNVVNVDVVVTDKQGNIVTGLTKDDFTVFENGKEVPVSNFYEAAAMVKTLPLLVDTSAAPAPAPNPHPRRIIFFIDNSSLTNERRTRLIDQMREFSRKNLREGDQAMVATYGQSLMIRTPFTGDPEKLLAGFAEATTELAQGDVMRSRVAETEISIARETKFPMRLSLARSYAEEQRQMLHRSINAIASLMTAVAGVEGKKALVFASESFPIHPGREMFEAVDRWGGPMEGPNLQAGRQDPRSSPLPNTRGGGERSGRALSGSESQQEFRSATLEGRTFESSKQIEIVGTTANASGITLYPLHGGHAAGGGNASADQKFGGRQSRTSFALRENSEAGMKLLADVTGGEAWTRVGNYDEALNRIARDLDGYYSLGFKPSDAAATNRQIAVKLRNKRGYTVRARNSYTAKPAEVAMRERVIGNLFAASPATELPVTLQAGTAVADPKGLKVPFLVRVPLESILLQENNGTYTANLDVYVVAANARGDMSDVIHRTETVKLTPEQKAKVRYHSYPMTLMMEKGARVSVAVVDAATKATGFARYEMD